MEESSSNSELSSDWDILPGPEEKIEMEVPDEEDKKEEKSEEVLDTTIENSDHIDLSEEVMQVRQVVDDMRTEMTEENNCHDSSSDVDVLEENVDDMNESFPSMDASFSFNTENFSENMSSSHQDSDASAQQTWHQTAFTFIWTEMKEIFYRCFNDYIHPNREFVKVGVAISITLFALQMSYMAKNMEHTKKDKKNIDMNTQMMQRLKTLETENKELKSQVLLKIQNDKLFLLLEEQITHLKNENSKLSGTMEDLIDQLEEQTIFKVENKNRERGIHEPYKKEIYKLKEQINILRFDNEDLQKQLVRMRYGSQPIQQTHKGNSHKHKQGDTELDQTHSPPSEIVTEEINDLQKKVFAELEKLKNWKDTVHKLITEHEKSRSEQKLEGETHEKSKNKKHKKFYDWSWKDIKKNLKGSLEKFPVTLSEMFTKYVIIDQKKIENSFELVNSYFKKAHDKTSKVFTEFTEENLFWDKLDTLKKQWHKVKDDFFNPAHNSKDDFTDPVSFDSYLADPAKFKKYEMAQNSKLDTKSKEDIKTPSFKVQEKFSEKSQEYQDYLSTKAGDNKLDDFGDENLAESKWHVKDTTPKNVDSWLMDRAAQRSEMRSESNVETDEVNWFLRKNKDKEG